MRLAGLYFAVADLDLSGWFPALMVACVAVTPKTAHVDLARVGSGQLRAKEA
jgi:hypothetical protein